MNGRLMSVDCAAAQFLLSLLAGLLQPLQGHGVLAQIDAILFLELVGHVVHQHLIEIVTAEVCIAVSTDDAEHAIGHFEYGHVERAAAKVEDHDLLTLLLIEPVGQRGGGRLIDDPCHFQPGNLAGILRGLTLRVVKIRRHGDDRFVDLVPEIRLGRLFELAQN